MTKEEAAVRVAEALLGISLCGRCHGDGFWVYFESDGIGTERYECDCVKVRRALSLYERVKASEAKV